MTLGARRVNPLCAQAQGRQSRGRPGCVALTERSSPKAPTEPALSRLAPASQNSLRSLGANSARTTATSMRTKRASAPGTSRAIAGALSSCAPQPARPRLCKAGVGRRCSHAHQLVSRGGRRPAGAISGTVALLGPGVGARSALCDLTRRGCPSGACLQHAQRVLRRDLRAKQRNEVRAQRGPSQHEPSSGVGCREATPRKEERIP